MSDFGGRRYLKQNRTQSDKVGRCVCKNRTSNLSTEKEKEKKTANPCMMNVYTFAIEYSSKCVTVFLNQTLRMLL